MAPPGPPEEEHRIYPRVPASGHASIRVLGEPLTQDGQVVNLSRSGVLLETSPLAIGTRVRTEFLGLYASGTVVREFARVGASRSPGIAVHFDEIQDPDWKGIRIRRG